MNLENWVSLVMLYTKNDTGLLYFQHLSSNFSNFWQKKGMDFELLQVYLICHVHLLLLICCELMKAEMMHF